jgi:hypothetical protein
MNYQESNDEERLTRELGSLKAEMNKLSAPDSVEARVLEAFRARKVVPFTPRRSNSRYWLAAVAAVLLIAMSVVALRWKSNTETPRREIAENPAPEKPKDEPNNPQPINELPRQVEYQAVDHSPKRKPVRNQRVRRNENARVAHHVREIATDFIPLRYMNAASLQDGGQVVRVELPRSALANFGLPVNMDRYNEKVKADVIFGVDGLAHAIRFVQ